IQANRVAFDLDVPLLHDVEQAHLDLAREIGELVDREDPAVRPGQQSEVHGELVGQEVAAARGLDGVHVADDVGDGDVGRGELLHKAGLARQPGDRRVGALFGHALAPVLRDRRERVVVHLAPSENRYFFVEQRDELAQDAALRLSPQAQQDEIVAGQDGVPVLRDDGVLVAGDPRGQRWVGLGATGPGSRLSSTTSVRPAPRKPYAPGQTATARATPVRSTSFTTAPVRSSAGFTPTTATPGSAMNSPESLRGSAPEPTLAYGAL